MPEISAERLNHEFAKAAEKREEELPKGISPDANRLPFNRRRKA